MNYKIIGACLALCLATGCGDDKKDPQPSPDMGQGDSGDMAEADAQDMGADQGDAQDMAQVDLPEGPQGEILGVPQSEEWALEGLRDTVHVVRTEANVPHIYATNAHDLYFAEGFIMARDRYLEFELGRRLGAGRISELLGDDALEIDQMSRGLGRTDIAATIWERLGQDQRDIFEAYAGGINAYIQAAIDGTAPLPTEIQLAGGLLGGGAAELMKPVTGQDVVSFVTVIVSQLGFEFDDLNLSAVAASLPGRFEGAALAELRDAGVRQDLFAQVGPNEQVSSAAGWGIEGASQKPGAARPHPQEQARRPGAWRVQADVLERMRERGDRYNQLLRRPETGAFGSNGWAVGGSGTPDGSSLLAGDGHLALGIPSIFYQMGLDTQVFGEGDVHQLGLAFPGFPWMTVGTNGKVAWTQTYLYADVTDWYQEQLQLGDDGLPAATLFQEQWRPLEKIEEDYTIANVPALGSVGRTETWARWRTFDGRPITSVEGRVLALDEQPAQGEAVVTMLGQRIVPGDMDGDGVVTAISFDYTGFDIGDVVGAVDGFHKAQDIHQWREQTRKLVSYAQSISASDDQGNITYTGYNGIPCRSYLARDDEGRWLEGADPRFLLDGTTYRGFTVPLKDDKTVDEEAGQEDPYKCVIPFEEFPQSLNPERGYVLNANNDPGRITFDGSIFDDPWYMGYAWSAGYRADTIDQGLRAATQSKSADIDAMAAIQGDVRSRLGLEFGPRLLEALARVKALGGQELEPWQQRASGLYQSDAAALDEAAERLQAWIARGAQARSGVETFYASPSAQDREDAVATMIFNVWLRTWYQLIFSDEQIEDIWVGNGSANRVRALRRLLDGVGPDNPAGLAAWNPDTEEPVFFDVLGTEAIERSDEIAVMSLAQSLTWLRAQPDGPGVGGFGTEDMSQWLWGLRHQVEFASILLDFAGDNPAVGLIADPLSITTDTLPLAERLESGDPRRRLKWFPRDGDWFSVDAANPGWGGADYNYSAGPVMRMVIQLKDGRVQGQNIIPGGQSGIAGTEHFADQAALWLGNQTLPMRFHPEDVAQGATGRELLRPAP